MRFGAALLTIVAVAALPLQLAVAKSKPAVQASHHHPVRVHVNLVYRIDRVTASIAKKHLVITVDGAVETGGWQHPRLVAKPSAPEAPVLSFNFVADPPKPKHVVIDALLPVHVTLTRGLPRYGTVAVEIIARTNEITTQITRWN